MEYEAMRLKQHINSGQPTIGSWITLGHVGIAEIMAGAGFDWLVVDLEHSTISTDVAGELIRVIDLCGVAPLVRVTSNEPDQIKRMMDAGAHGIIVPMVNTPKDAERAVSAVHYPPRGTRGVGLARAQSYGASFDRYKSWLAEQAVVIVQVEHIDAVNNLEAILAVPGVDGYIIGPYDLSASMGHPGQFDRPEFLSAIAKVREVGKKADKAGGIHVVEPDLNQLKRSLDEGWNFLAYSVDIRMLDSSCRAWLSVKGGDR